MDFEYIYAYQYNDNKEFIDIRTQLSNVGFHLSLLLDIPDGLIKYAVIAKYKTEYYIINYDYSQIRSSNVQYIFDKYVFISKSIQLLINNKTKENNMKNNNIEVATITLERYNSLQEKAKTTDEQIEKLIVFRINEFKKDLENKLGITIQEIDNIYSRTNRTIKDRLNNFRKCNSELKAELNAVNEELDTCCKNHNELYIQYDELCTKHAALKAQHEMLEKKYQQRKEDYVKLAKSKWYNFKWLMK